MFKPKKKKIFFLNKANQSPKNKIYTHKYSFIHYDSYNLTKIKN